MCRRGRVHLSIYLSRFSVDDRIFVVQKATRGLCGIVCLPLLLAPCVKIKMVRALQAQAGAETAGRVRGSGRSPDHLDFCRGACAPRATCTFYGA